MGYYVNEINMAGKIAVDDTILVKGVPATAGSKMLESFKPLFNAEVVDRLLSAGYELSGKTNVGEFGLDKLTAYRRDTIGEDMSLKVIVLMLNQLRHIIIHLHLLRFPVLV